MVLGSISTTVLSAVAPEPSMRLTLRASSLFIRTGTVTVTLVCELVTEAGRMVEPSASKSTNSLLSGPIVALTFWRSI